METISEQNLPAIINLYCHLDRIRAKKFINPEKLESDINSSGVVSFVQGRFPEWKFLLSGLKEGFSSKIPTMEFVAHLRKLEPYPLVLWLIITSIAMLTANADLWRIQAGIAVLVFIFLVGARLANFYLVDKPSSQIITKIMDSVPGMDQKLFDVIKDLIYLVDDHLLTNELSAYPYRHYLEFMEYPGIYYHGRRTLLGPSRIQSTPFPLYCALSKAKENVRIIMARMDEKLILILGQIPQEVLIQLLTMNSIARHTSFNIAVTNLYKAHSNLQITLMAPDHDINGVTVFVGDDVWTFDSTAKWNETRYILIKEPELSKENVKSFKSLWNKGRLTKVRS